MRQAREPFQFVAASYLVRICAEKATTLAELHRLLKKASKASIFHHTFQSLETYHYLTEGFTNDFAQWILAACNEHPLAEQVAAVDIRDYISLDDLRARLLEIIGSYLKGNAAAGRRKSFEPFYFCEGVTITVPTGNRVYTLKEFLGGVEAASHSSLHFHFLTSRLRVHLVSNDFSLWLRTNLDLPELAEQIELIDIYANTLEGVRQKVLELGQPWVEQ